MPEPPRIRVQRVYEIDRALPREHRVLVDRVWPRGVSKESLKLDLWAKEVAPSNSLRKWFDHDPVKWAEFQNRYRFELAEKLPQLKELAELAAEGPLVLLYGARDETHNQAVVLKEVLEEGIEHS